ncbi:hypothetical protein BC937DRAFT_86679 [Endogone sp. FLAS-F59071]|nr:hypothetical protein BC937DRAFT_86679 [Endogone sp. FLAS-F59071]|eukprot:RUS19940.1 hypothetical protein BC937DRAFT_86679 [Endogone sp. FLAS-F59071]
MDAAAKRFTWSILASLQSSKVIILTSHSMEEVDAVCSRVGIMVGGRLRALGSPAGGQRGGLWYGRRASGVVRAGAGTRREVRDAAPRRTDAGECVRVGRGKQS